MPRELQLVAPYALALQEYDEPPLAANEVRARAIMSAISHGTEINLYRGTSPFHEKRFDPQKRLFVADDSQHSYPQMLGYEWVGEVIAVGSAVSEFAVGDRIHLPRPHRETHTFVPADIAKLEVVAPLPPDITPTQAIFLSTISIALQAIHDAQIKVGDHVVIFGLGALGLLSVQLVALNGAGRIDAVDPVMERRELTTGAAHTFDPITEDVGAVIKNESPGADIAIEFSGSYAALHNAIRCVRMGGLVVAAGFYQGAATALYLGEEWHHNRVTMVSSTRSWGNPHRHYPLWDRPRLREASLELLKDRQLRLDDLLTHTIPFERAQDAYALIDSGAHDVLKVALDYTKD